MVYGICVLNLPMVYDVYQTPLCYMVYVYKTHLWYMCIKTPYDIRLCVLNPPVGHSGGPGALAGAARVRLPARAGEKKTLWCMIISIKNPYGAWYMSIKTPFGI
jgi:hypothetical protein